MIIQFGVETKFKKLELERFRDFDLAWKGIGIDEASLIYGDNCNDYNNPVEATTFAYVPVGKTEVGNMVWRVNCVDLPELLSITLML